MNIICRLRTRLWWREERGGQVGHRIERENTRLNNATILLLAKRRVRGDKALH